VDALRASVGRESSGVFECFCTPYAQNTPLFPVVGLVERVLGFTRVATDAEKRVALEERLALRGVLNDETFALMAALLGILPDDPDPLADYSPQRLRERTLETLLEWLLAVTRDGPTLWVVEDLHWADPTTLEFVGSVLESMSSEPLLTILTFRPDLDPPWQTNGRVSAVTLTRLAPEETSSMAIRVARGKTIPDDVLSQIVERTEGVPLFVEEVTKAVLELGVLVEQEDRFELSGPLPQDLIPATVQGSLSARLDRLGPAKAIAQLAATIGREFGYELLSTVAENGQTELRQGLDRLIDAELVYRRGDSLEETYLFKHALIRDAAYQSLLRKSRRALHERIAEALVSRFPETATLHPELVAEHYSAAGRADEAVTQWLLAGQLAVARAANHEAIGHLKRGLELVSELPATEQRQRELDFLIAFQPAWIAVEGWASPELGRVVERAKELVEVRDEPLRRFAVQVGEVVYLLCSGRVAQSIEPAGQLLELANATGDPLLITVARGYCSMVHAYRGDHRECIEHSEATLALLDIERERVIARMFSLSSCVAAAGYPIFSWWNLGYPERSVQADERGVALALEIGNPNSLAFALTSRTCSSYLQGDPSRIIKACDEALRVAHEERLGFWEPMISVFRGHALSELGEPAEGSALIRSAIEQYHAAGSRAEQIMFFAILAGAEWKAGEWDDAFGTLATAIAVAKQDGEGLFEPELYRLKGEFLLAQAIGAAGPSTAEPSDDRETGLAHAERCIRESLDLARRQEARMLELRSLVSLCRVRRELGDFSHERDELAEVYGAFTEGFETPDLLEAGAMLELVKA
jgi:tetratricopeptide (TPR) repeat protein